MAPQNKPFSRKTATTYALVNRPQHDPRIHDTDAPAQVFTEISGPSSRHAQANKIKSRGDLEDEFGLSIRDNEGEAAEHGIFFDDTSYDYMQHLREVGTGGAQTTWLEAPKPHGKQGPKVAGKARQTLEEALQEARLDDDAEEDDIFGTRAAQRPLFEEQQELPDALTGFQPDMDPRLREVLAALDDEAYVDDEDDIFKELAGEGGQEVGQDEWEATGDFGLEDEDDAGWETDDTTKPAKEYADDMHAAQFRELEQPDLDRQSSAALNGDLMADLAKGKIKGSAVWADSESRSIASEATPSLGSNAPEGRRKKKKSALAPSTIFSMTSSSVTRSEALTTLDARFERTLDMYMNDIDEEEDDDYGEFIDDAASSVSGMSRLTGASRRSTSSRMSMPTGPARKVPGQEALEEDPPNLSSTEFNSALDDFLVSSGRGKGRRMKKGGKQGTWGQQGGLEQLDEIRSGLGPARFASRTAKSNG